MPHYLILALKTKQKQNNRENNPQRVVRDVASMPHQTPIQSTLPVFMLIPQINKEPKHGRNQQKKIYIYIKNSIQAMVLAVLRGKRTQWGPSRV